MNAPTTGCTCIDTINAALAKRNRRIELPLMLGPEDAGRPLIRTEQIKKRRWKKKAVDTIDILAAFCPFCGAAYRSGDAS